MKRFLGDKILYIIFSVLSLVLGIILLPNITDWCSKIIGIIVCLIIIIYLISYFIRKWPTDKLGKIISIVEIILLASMATLAVVSQYKNFQYLGECRIVALALWIQGTCEFVKVAYNKAENGKVKAINVVLTIFLISIGAYAFADPVSNKVLEYIVCCSFLLAAIFFAIVAVIFFNVDKALKKAKDEQEGKDKKDVEPEVVNVEVITPKTKQVKFKQIEDKKIEEKKVEDKTEEELEEKPAE